MKPTRIIALAVLASLGTIPLLASPVRVGPVTAELVCETTSVAPGQPFVVGLRLTMDEGWHTYGREPGDAGQPTEITWELPPGYTAGPLFWPPDSSFTLGPITSRGYAGDVILAATVSPPADAPPSGSAPIRAHVSWLACSDQCMPGSADLALDVPVSRETPAADPALAPLFAATRMSGATSPASGSATSTSALMALLLPALLGGMILNLMPCVFPVLGIKIMGFVHQSGAERRRVTMHGLVFAAGVLVSFWLLAGGLLVLRAGGQHLGWGFQLQSPLFVFGLAAFLFIFGLSMSGVFEFGLAATGVGSSLQSKDGYAGSFFTGVLVTVVSTPCAAPFLAPALGAALTLPPAHSLVLFTLIAVGLSLPYLVLSAFPRLVKLLPRPGAWMETFKQVMAFPLYGTVAFLLWVLAGQLEADALFASLLGLVALAMGAWAYGRWAQRAGSTMQRRIGWLAALLLMAAGVGLGAPRTHTGTLVWREWSPELVAEQRARGKVVYVDFTARWCATCKMNKLAVFSSDRVARAFEEQGVVAVRADWTNRNPAITEALAAFHRSAVPFNVVYGPGRAEPILLPEVLTPEIVLDAVARAAAPAVTAAAP